MSGNPFKLHHTNHLLPNQILFRLFIHNLNDFRFKVITISIYWNLSIFQRFLDEVLQEPDVYFVTNWQAIEWMRSPTILDKLHSFHPWKCNRKFKKSEIVCDRPNVCKLYSRVFQEERTMFTCTECPSKYPWIRNEFGIDWFFDKQSLYIILYLMLIKL